MNSQKDRYRLSVLTMSEFPNEQPVALGKCLHSQLTLSCFGGQNILDIIVHFQLKEVDCGAGVKYCFIFERDNREFGEITLRGCGTAKYCHEVKKISAL